MKPKQNNTGGSLDKCYTPAYALDPLEEFLPRGTTIWEPAAGSGRLARALARRGFDVITSERESGGDFFRVEPDEPWDVLVTNPPYSDKYKWIARCYDLGRPWALLVPVETIGAGTAMELFEQNGGPVAAFEQLMLKNRIHFEMPYKGDPLVYRPEDDIVDPETGKKPPKGTAQFPVFWLCSGLLGAPRVIRPVYYWCELDLVPPAREPRPALLRDDPTSPAAQLALPIAA